VTKAQQRYNKIAHFVNYAFRNNAKTKAKIKRHYDKLKPHLSRPTAVFKSKSDKRIKAAAAEAGLGKIGKSLKAVPFDNVGAVKGFKVRWNKGIVFDSPNLEARSIKFNKAKFKKVARNENAITEFLEGELDDLDPDDLVQIDVRGFMLKSENTKEEAIAEISRLWMKYRTNDKTAANDPAEFITGVRAAKTKNQRKSKSKKKSAKSAKGKTARKSKVKRGKRILGGGRGNRPVQKGKGSKAVPMGRVQRRGISRTKNRKKRR